MTGGGVIPAGALGEAGVLMAENEMSRAFMAAQGFVEVVR
jgi:hypothetical protein